MTCPFDLVPTGAAQLGIHDGVVTFGGRRNPLQGASTVWDQRFEEALPAALWSASTGGE